MTVEKLQKDFEAAQKQLHNYMDFIRSNYIGGLTELTETQKKTIDRLYEKVNKLSSILLEVA